MGLPPPEIMLCVCEKEPPCSTNSRSDQIETGERRLHHTVSQVGQKNLSVLWMDRVSLENSQMKFTTLGSERVCRTRSNTTTTCLVFLPYDADCTTITRLLLRPQDLDPNHNRRAGVASAGP